MTAFDLIEKVHKAEEAVEKAKKTIRHHEALAEKKLRIIRENGWDENDRYARYGKADYDESYWTVTDYENHLDDAENARKKLADKERILQNWRVRLEAAMDRENRLRFEVPESMKEMQRELVSDWDHYDIELRDKMKKAREEMPRKEFVRAYTQAARRMLNMSESEIHSENVRTAEDLVLDLYGRICLITGDVTDWSDIHYGGKALNGMVAGKLGKVRVESIVAGGYNIQKRHIRVLVHEVSA